MARLPEAADNGFSLDRKPSNNTQQLKAAFQNASGVEVDFFAEFHEGETTVTQESIIKGIDALRKIFDDKTVRIVDDTQMKHRVLLMCVELYGYLSNMSDFAEEKDMTEVQAAAGALQNEIDTFILADEGYKSQLIQDANSHFSTVSYAMAYRLRLVSR